MSKYQDKTNVDNIINKKTCKGVSKATVKYDITHKDYLDVLEDEKILKKEVVSLRSFNHQLFTYVENKTALTPYYDKMQLIDKNTCVPFGYLGS